MRTEAKKSVITSGKRWCIGEESEEIMRETELNDPSMWSRQELNANNHFKR